MDMQNKNVGSVPGSEEEAISCGEDEEIIEVCADCEQDPCVCDDGEDEVAELAEEADDKVDALINILIKKGVFTEEEFEKEFENMFEDTVDKEVESEAVEENSAKDEVPVGLSSGQNMRTF